MPGPERSGELSLPRLLAYAGPGLPLAALTLPVYLYVAPLYAVELALDLSVVGGILFAARLFDMLSDPLIGMLSDRWRLPWGRRRPWLIAGLPLVMLAQFQLFQPPEAAGEIHLLGWSLALYVGWTMVMMPYLAWGAELSEDYHGRSRVVGAREIAVVLGTIVAAALPAVLADGAEGRRAELAPLAWFLLLALPLTGLLAVLAVPDPRPPAAAPNPASGDWRAGWRVLAGNRPFGLLIAAYLLNGAANGLTATLFFLFAERVLILPDQAQLFLVAYFACGIVSVPLWLMIARRLGKHRAWSAGLAAACLGFAAVPFLGAGDGGLFLAVCILTGLCLGSDLALPASMQADVVDVDRAKSGSRRTGLYFSLWSMATKLSLALAAGVALPALDLAGFRADMPGDGGGLWMLTLLYGGVPIAIKLAAIACVWRFPLDAEAVQRLQSDLRESG